MAGTEGADDPLDAGGVGVPVRPQALLLTLFGAYVRDPDLAVAAGGLVEVLRRAGVGEHATRSTLARMTRGGLLVAHRSGRLSRYALTPRAAVILADAAHRVWHDGVVDRDWDGRWTLLSFSLPESRRADRHRLRSRLAWAGFGPLRSGLWIAPRATDPVELLADLGVDGHVTAFAGQPLPSTDPDRVIAEAWDLGALRASYEAFLARWDVADPVPDAPDDLVRHLLLLTEWLVLVREDPRLPLRHLPADWPGLRAERVARLLRAAFEAPAQVVADEIVPRHAVR